MRILMLAFVVTFYFISSGCASSTPVWVGNLHPHTGVPNIQYFGIGAAEHMRSTKTERGKDGTVVMSGWVEDSSHPGNHIYALSVTLDRETQAAVFNCYRYDAKALYPAQGGRVAHWQGEDLGGFVYAVPVDKTNLPEEVIFEVTVCSAVNGYPSSQQVYWNKTLSRGLTLDVERIYKDGGASRQIEAAKAEWKGVAKKPVPAAKKT